MQEDVEESAREAGEAEKKMQEGVEESAREAGKAEKKMQEDCSGAKTQALRGVPLEGARGVPTSGEVRGSGSFA